MDSTLKMLKDLTDADAIAGNEREARNVMQRYLEPLTDEITYDKLGSIIGLKKGVEEGPRIMVSGHLDEVGFMVSKITEEGFIKFQTIGGWWSQVLLSQQVTITTRNGKKVHGVIGSVPPHVLSPEERKKPFEIKNMFIDIGAPSKEKVEELGIRPGDMITPYIEFRTMADEKYLLAKAWDNRIGCAIAIEVLRQLQNEQHPNWVYATGNVQEEIGLRGARTAAYKIKPDIGIATDVGVAGDTPGVKDNDSKLGNGPQIFLYDASMVGHKGLRDFVIDVAEELDIPYQLEVLTGGGTDGGMMHLSHEGAPTIAICVPSRYIHSHTSMIHRDDFENAVKLIVEVIKRLDIDTVNRITFD